MDVLIPIARRRKTGEYVFIDDVVSGLACDCECIGCGVALVARKGEVNTHYFAHEAKSVDKEIICPFNFERAIYWMARKVISDADSIALPDYEFRQNEPSHGFYYKNTVTKASINKIDSVEFIDDEIHDGFYLGGLIMITIEGHPLIMTLENGVSDTTSYTANPKLYRGKEYPHVALDVSFIRSKFSELRSGYSDLIKKVVVESAIHKLWIYHPRERPIRDECNSELAVLVKKHRRQQEEEAKAKLIIDSETAKKEVINKEFSENPIEKTSEILNTRLTTLVDRASYLYGANSGCPTTVYLCKNCMFLNKNSASCEYCRETTVFEEVLLDDSYMYCIERKYFCWNYPMKSLAGLRDLSTRDKSKLTKT
ncbi:MAG: hypothetical protein JKX76_03655 [Colwellia sp.]|nr:hypothetical protein [Colwellia sp.]